MKRIAATCLVLVAAFGCQDNQLGLERRRPNRAPQTTISGRPQTSPSGNNHHVHIYWSGVDADGRIDHYDYILMDHPAVGDPQGGIDSLAAGHFAGTVPTVEDRRWTATFSLDSLFVTRADSLPRPPQPGPGETNEFVRRQSFQRWHTFFIRAVDNEGLVDATPDWVSFNATTLAPTVSLQGPIAPGHPFHAPRTIVFQWTGEDPPDNEDDGPDSPLASRWILIPTPPDPNGVYVGYPDSLYSPRAVWSPWESWQAADGAGRRTVVRDLEAVDPSRPGTGYYVFAVQAMDEAGAVTPVFDDRSANKNNAVRVFVSGTVGPTLVLQERFLGSYSIIANSPPLAFDIAGEQSVRLHWRADASSYGGSIAGYRWGWDIRNLEDDTAWQQGWSQTATAAPERVFAQGIHKFYLEVRDDAGSITRAVLELTVHQLTGRRDVLLVDDTLHPRPELEEAEDRRWREVLTAVARDNNFLWDPSLDVYEVRSTEGQNQPPPLARIFEYRAVVWAVIQSSNGAALRTLASFYDPFLESNATRVPPYNYLNPFLDNGGCLWICGAQPANLLWPFNERPRGQGVPPVNVVNWNEDLHPGVDSVGVSSFLYRMGVEAFDLGAGGRAPAPRGDLLQHGCTGLRRATPQGQESRRFTTRTAAQHEHEVVVPTADVEAGTPHSGRYATTETEGHVHELVLEPEDYVKLQRGERILLTTSEAALPVPHAHPIELEDPLGLWGAPPVLEAEASWSLPNDRNLNPWGSRPNIEIYDMPNFMALATPPLRPIDGLLLAPYVYSSGVAAGSTPQMHYPLTADGQPALVMRKSRAEDQRFTRAFCGFEPWLLRSESHRRLMQYVLVHQMHLGVP